MEMVSIGLAGMKICSSEDEGEGEGEAKTSRESRIRRDAIRKEVVSGEVEAKPRRGNRIHRDANRMETFSSDGEAKTQRKNREHSAEESEEDAIIHYRRFWERCFGGRFGSFDDETALGPMLHTSGPIPKYAVPECTLQIFSIRVTALKDGLEWPLHVHGLVATRDIGS